MCKSLDCPIRRNPVLIISSDEIPVFVKFYYVLQKKLNDLKNNLFCYNFIS